MDTVTSADGTAIAFDRRGQGPALVLVLGAFCDRRSPTTLAETLAPDFTVYAYDRRGRGDSEERSPAEPRHEIADLAALIDAAGGEAFVFGHSSGAVLALEAAAAHLPIERLVAYEPPYIVDDTRTRPVQLDERVTALLAEGRNGDAAERFLIEAAEVPPPVVAGMRAGPSWAGMEALAPTLVYDLLLCGDQVPPAGRLGRIECPTLVLSGGDSPPWARAAVDAVAGLVPGAAHRSLAGQTHGCADDVLAPVLVEHFLG